MSARKFLGQAIDVVEVAVRLVFMFLVQLGLVKAVIVKFDRCGRGRLAGGNWGSFRTLGLGFRSLRKACASRCQLFVIASKLLRHHLPGS